jgi:type VI secretion system protein ImpH
MPVSVLQCHGQWLRLNSDDQAVMPSARGFGPRNNQLGVNVVVGERIWEVQSKFRLRLGPLTWREFRTLMPNGPALRPLCEVARTFVGPALDFDVQPVLKSDEIPACRLVPDPVEGPYLGWTTWMPDSIAPDAGLRDDAVFSIDTI